MEVIAENISMGTLKNCKKADSVKVNAKLLYSNYFSLVILKLSKRPLGSRSPFYDAYITLQNIIFSLQIPSISFFKLYLY